MTMAVLFRRLRAANLGLAVLHAGQAALIVATRRRPRLAGHGPVGGRPAGERSAAARELFEIPVRWAVAAFLLMAAVDHLVVSLPRVVGWYERNLRRRINYARWIEYSFSAS